MTNKIIINNWTGGGTLQTWTDGEWQILYAKDSAENCVTLSLNSGDAIRLAYAVSPTPSEIFERMRAANEAVYEMSYPEARADELRHIAGEIDCGGSCEECSQQKLDRGEFCDFVAAENLRKLASALELKSKIDASRPDAAALSNPVAANASAEARLREAFSRYLDEQIAKTSEWQRNAYAAGNDRKGEKYHAVHCVLTEVKMEFEALSAHPHASDCDKQGADCGATRCRDLGCFGACKPSDRAADVTMEELQGWLDRKGILGSEWLAHALLDAFTVGRR